MSAGAPRVVSQKFMLYGVRTKIAGTGPDAFFGRYTSNCILAPSRIGTMSFRSITAIRSSSRSRESRRAMSAVFGCGRAWAPALLPVIASATTSGASAIRHCFRVMACLRFVLE
jgi:hypothetical protein